MDTSRTSRRTRTVSLLTAVASVLVVTGCSTDGPGFAPGAEPAAADQVGRACSSRAQGQHTLVALADLDGSHTTYPLQDLPGGNQTNPDWSPDGSRFVFVHRRREPRRPCGSSDADGGDARELLALRRACCLARRPGLVARRVEHRLQPHRVARHGRLGVAGDRRRADRARCHVLLAPRVRTFTAGARWSPDGSQIVFESVHKDGRASVPMSTASP